MLGGPGWGGETVKRLCAGVLLASSLCLVIGCVTKDEEPLPAVRQPRIFEAPVPCAEAPPLHPFAEPIEKGSDAAACLPESWTGPELPTERSSVDGRVTAVRFYDQCENKLVPVEASIRACNERAVGTWRYAPGVTPCSTGPWKGTVVTVVRRPDKPESARCGG